jgi:hypothetical protein
VRIPRAAWLRFTVDVPTRGYVIDVQHIDSDINRLSVSPFFASDTEPRVTDSTATLAAPASVAIDGWTIPTSGVLVTWTHNTPTTPLGGG